MNIQSSILNFHLNCCNHFKPFNVLFLPCIRALFVQLQSSKSTFKTGSSQYKQDKAQRVTCFSFVLPPKLLSHLIADDLEWIWSKLKIHEDSSSNMVRLDMRLRAWQRSRQGGGQIIRNGWGDRCAVGQNTVDNRKGDKALWLK